ncbi:MAG TPA: hypothetical protein VEO18_05930 [Thermoplasmata archaeon]|nr:hypothetical protein [Thermoplasmata archaeon]
MSTITAARKIDRLYEIRGTLRLMASPLLWTARTYVLGARNLIHVIHRKPVRKVERPVRSYDSGALARARALFPSEYMRAMREIGFDNDDVFLAHLRTLPVAIAGGHSFAAVWDNVCDDERLTDSEVESLSREAVAMLGRDMEMEGLL